MNNLENTVVLSQNDSDEKTIILKAIEKSGKASPKDLSPIDIQDVRNDLSDVNSNFDIYDSFAEGGQGVISRAKDKVLKRPVAIKSLKLTAQNLTDKNQRLFCDEAILTAQLDHPSIIPIYSLNKDDKGSFHFSMKLVKGVTLKDYFQETLLSYRVNGLKGVEEKIALRSRIDIFLKVCDAMAFAHSKGVIHRDLKPDNIMIGEFNEVYVMDWGIAIFDQSNATQKDLKASELGVCGTPGYMSPAVLNGEYPSVQSDIYSLGMILHEVATLEKGFIGVTAEERITHARTGNLKDVEHFYSHVKIPRDLRAIITKARSARSQDSYDSVLDFADDIRRYLVNAEVEALPDNIIRSSTRWLQNHLKQSVIAVCVLLLGMAALNIHTLNEQITLEQDTKIEQEKLANYQAAVTKKAHKIDNLINNVEHLLLDSAERLQLSLPGASAMGGKVYSSKDFDTEATRPKDVSFSKVFGKDISVSSLGYKLAPGITLSETKGYLNYLYTFTKDFQNVILRSEITANRQLYNESQVQNTILNKEMPVRWVYAGFDNGVFVSYPGKGGYPVDYDHRKRPWYMESMQHKGLHWGAPYFDVNGLGLVLPCTYTVEAQGDSPKGVIGVDVTLDFILDDLMEAKSDSAFVEAAILDANGRVVISTEYERFNEKSGDISYKTIESKFYSNTQVLSALQKGKKQIILEENDIEFVYEIAEISELKWYYLEKKAMKDL